MYYDCIGTCIGTIGFTNQYSMLVCTQSALGWDHQEQLSKHESQTDAAKGFGGKYGVQKESQDKVCEGIHVMARHC